VDGAGAGQARPGVLFEVLMASYEPHEGFAAWARAYGPYGGKEHEVGNRDCPACTVTERCDCGGVVHTVEVLLYPEWGDVGYVHMCDKCGKEWAL